MKRIAIIIITAGIALIAMSAVQFFMRPGTGDQIPSFTLQSISGEEIYSDDLSGKPMLVHFWATWCGYCREEFPSLVRLAEDEMPGGLVVMAISEDEDKNRDLVVEFADRYNPPFSIFHDKDGQVADIFGSYGMPETVAVDRNGVIIRRFTGMVNWDSKEARDFVDSLLK